MRCDALHRLRQVRAEVGAETLTRDVRVEAAESAAVSARAAGVPSFSPAGISEML